MSYLEALVKTGGESIEATLRKRRILFTASVARMEDTRLPKCVMFGELVEAAISAGGKRKNGWGISWRPSEFSAPTPTSGRSQPRTRGNSLGPLNKGWSSS